MTAVNGGLQGGGTEQKIKRAHGQQCGDCGRLGEGGWEEVEEGIRGINSNGKEYNKQ